jgi:hypothetical protein
MRMIPGHKHLVLEEGLQSAWFYETLSPHVDEFVVAGITESQGHKSDKRDAYGPAEKLRVGNFDKPALKVPRQFTRLRELSRSLEPSLSSSLDLVQTQLTAHSVRRQNFSDNRIVFRREGSRQNSQRVRIGSR